MAGDRTTDRAAQRLRIATEVLCAMVRSAPPSLDMTALNKGALAREAVAFADALLDALNESSRGNAK
jgi:hypothetical protein